MGKLTPALVLQDQGFSDKTYKLSAEKIEGFADGLEALKQAIHKVHATEQYEYPIYSFKYGIAWKELIGEERPYVRAEMKRMILSNFSGLLYFVMTVLLSPKEADTV